MNLVVDIGNTSVKMAVFQNNSLLHKLIFPLSDFSNNFQKIKIQFPEIETTILSSVVKTISKEKKLLQRDTYFFELTQALSLPFENKYATPATLGKDRIALVAAAVAKFPKKNTLVIDAGTCVTFDFKNDKEEYLGGAISPGLEMRFKALHNFTANLPLLKPGENLELIGGSTEASMTSGVVNGLLLEIDGTIASYATEYEDLTIILTGGDAQFLSVRLKNSIFANSNFLLEGLNYILEFNKTQ
ncbi:type III pantothenate kinase [Autumnicola edwardsiae]|jgi:type III pantothenate kinase|uniref:Type III pantothenate kinase n=1 Tax=Autumnicola edwardsiae TaxID=3075594 RepID=A0ABU3CWF3_9FLAO|nr:type III pantothenate kinase [Zunongwangia sp. F297]MDT0650563.1 type III pantothenate kinase [Zunongwangia sp. F297]